MGRPVGSTNKPKAKAKATKAKAPSKAKTAKIAAENASMPKASTAKVVGPVVMGKTIVASNAPVVVNGKVVSACSGRDAQCTPQGKLCKYCAIADRNQDFVCNNHLTVVNNKVACRRCADRIARGVMTAAT